MARAYNDGGSPRTQIGDGSDIVESWFYASARTAELKLRNALGCTQMNNARTNSAVQTSVSNPAWGDQSAEHGGAEGAQGVIIKGKTRDAFSSMVCGGSPHAAGTLVAKEIFSAGRAKNLPVGEYR